MCWCKYSTDMKLSSPLSHVLVGLVPIVLDPHLSWFKIQSFTEIADTLLFFHEDAFFEILTSAASRLDRLTELRAKAPKPLCFSPVGYPTSNFNRLYSNAPSIYNIVR